MFSFQYITVYHSYVIIYKPVMIRLNHAKIQYQYLQSDF